LLLPKKIEEEIDGLPLIVEDMYPVLPQGPNPPPASDKGCSTELRGMDRQGVIPRHVFSWLGSFDIEVIGLGDPVPMREPH
jgi:hypothetical protein